MAINEKQPYKIGTCEPLNEEKFDEAVKAMENWGNRISPLIPDPYLEPSEPYLKELEREHRELVEEKKKTAFKPVLGKLSEEVNAEKTMDEVRRDILGLNKTNKEEDNMLRDTYNLYEIIVVRKDSKETPGDYPELEIDKKVIAKSYEEAKGKAGVYDILEGEGYDDSKFSIEAGIVIQDIKPVKEEK